MQEQPSSQPQNDRRRRRLTVIMTGAGSGGHITPIISVAAELKSLSPDCRLIYIGQKGDKLADEIDNQGLFEKKHFIVAGKFRRYHGQSFLSQLFDIPTQLKNIRDFFYLLFGTVESFGLMLKYRPSAIFVKGGYVSVPVVFAARALRKPYLTHDSDAHPGLANRIAGKWAKWHAVGMPKHFYQYDTSTTTYTGVPINSHFHKPSPSQKVELRKALGYKSDTRLILVVGGGLGSKRLNELVLGAAEGLLKSEKFIEVIHITGLQNFGQVSVSYERKLTQEDQRRVRLLSFTNKLYEFSAIADLVITRAGATALAEFAAQSKACIVIPSPYLAGGHQLKNAEFFKEEQAVVVFDETGSSDELRKQVIKLLGDNQLRFSLGQNLHRLSKPDAARQLAKLLVKISR